MKTKPKIVYGGGPIHVDSFSPADVNITSISIDNKQHIVRIVSEIGMKVKTVEFSMEYAQSIGFINLNTLKEYV